jgi:hypothetical protein
MPDDPRRMPRDAERRANLRLVAVSGSQSLPLVEPVLAALTDPSQRLTILLGASRDIAR